MTPQIEEHFFEARQHALFRKLPAGIRIPPLSDADAQKPPSPSPLINSLSGNPQEFCRVFSAQRPAFRFEEALAGCQAP